MPEPVVSPVTGDGNQGSSLPDSPELLLQEDDDIEQMSSEDSPDEIEEKKSFMELEEWGLYPSVRTWYEDKGLTSLFPWQRDCLRADGVLDGKNLIFSAPTSAGKTMVADILIMKQVFNKKKKVLVVLPFISIVREKMNDLESMLKGTHIRIGAFMGSFHSKGGFDAVDIAVTTFEKANGYINRLCQENRLDTLGAVIVDEIHLIGDSNRGYLLELMLAKIMMANRQNSCSIQVIGMSATLPNLEDLGTWLDAVVYKTDFRPVPLTQMIQLGSKIINAETEEVVQILPNIPDASKLNYLLMKCFSDNTSVLVFENNKKSIETSAMKLAKQIGQSASNNSKTSENKRKLCAILENLQKDAISIVKAQLNNSGVKVDDDLLQPIEYGVAFHHAGLPMEHREIVEEAFKKGHIKVLFATSTLSSGVNLPARKVIIKTPCDYTRKSMMDVLTYRQMIGRAGRKGMDELGESILLCSPSEEEIGKKLTKALPSKITSCLTGLIADSSACLQRALLEAVVIGLIKTEDHVDDYLNCTLAMTQADHETKLILEQQRDHAMSFLTDKDGFMIRSKNEDSAADLKAGQLGKAVVAAGLPPVEGLSLMKHLQRARKGIVLSSDLHLLYLIIPEHSVQNIKLESERMKNFLMDFSQGGEFEQSFDVMTRLGFSYTSKALSRTYVEEITYKRFYVALAVNDLIGEIPIHELTQKYGIEKGALQSLQTSVSMFAGMVSSFCNKIGWSNMELLFRHLEARIESGVRSELIDIMRIPSMTVRVARRLYDANIDTVREIAHSSPPKILQILESTVELQSTSPLRRLSSMMWIEAHKRTMNLSEIADHLVREARSIIEKDIGSVDWEAGEKVASSQNVFKTPLKGKKKKLKQATPTRPLSLGNICKSIKHKVPSVSIGRNSLYTDENLSTQHDDPAVTPVNGQSGENNDESPAKSVFSSEPSSTSPTTSASSTVAPKILFQDNGDVMRKRRATPDSSVNERPKSKRRLGEESAFVDDFKHNVKPGPVSRTDVTDANSMKNMMAIWRKEKFAGIECVDIKCDAVIPEIGSRRTVQPTPSDRYDGIIFQDEMRVLTRIALCFGENESFSISGRDHLTTFGLILEEMISAEMSVTAFDVKHVYRIFKDCFAVDRKSLLSMEWFDLKICHWLRDPEAQKPASSDSLVKEYHGLDAYVPFATQLSSSVSFRCAILFPLRECMQKEVLNQHNFNHVFRTMEVPVTLLMAELESRGIGVDRPYMSLLAKEAFNIKKSLEGKARELAGVPKLNMGNIADIRKILYTKLNLLSLISDGDIDKNELRVKKMKETKGLPEHLSTTNRTLMTLSKYHRFPTLVIEHRKIQSARTKTIARVEEYFHDYKTNRIYSKFCTLSATGRMHMGEPDLQQTQNPFTVKFFTPEGREESRDINVRKIFIPSQGYQFVSADYRQLELRILAHLCRDEKLMQVINSGCDVFTELAAQLNEKEEVTHDERQLAKTLVYGVIYGIGSLHLSQKLEVSEDEAKEFRVRFHNTFPGIQGYIDNVTDGSTRQGFVETLVGRKRLLHGVSGDGEDRARALRQAVHTTIQGSAADLVKLAMIHLDQQIRENQISAFLVHEMHDELIYEVRDAEVKSFTGMISKTMQNVAKNEFPDTFAVDLPVKVRTGSNWGELVDVAEDQGS